MSDSVRVRVLSVEPAETVPGRFGEAGLRELIEVLGGKDDPDADVWELLRQTFDRHGVQDLGEQLLDAALIDPPIPAYCETLLRRMMDPNDPPWVDHEVAVDRFNLWYCHYLVHRAYPDRWPAPSVLRVSLEVTVVDPALRPPGRRSPPGDRTAFLARVLRARPGVNPIQASHGGASEDASEWAFDVVWASEVSSWTKLTEEEVAAAGITAPAGFVPFRFTAEAWTPPQWRGDITPAHEWTAAG